MKENYNCHWKYVSKYEDCVTNEITNCMVDIIGDKILGMLKNRVPEKLATKYLQTLMYNHNASFLSNDFVM